MTALKESGTKSNVGVDQNLKITFFPAVNAAVVDSQGRVLLTQRSAKVRAPGYWCLPGGHFDPGETWLSACVREVHEEVGIEVRGGRLVGIYSDPALNVVAHPLSPSGMGQFVTAVFLFEEYRGEIRPNEEVSEWGWFEPEQAPKPLLNSHEIRLADLRAFSGEAFFR